MNSLMTTKIAMLGEKAEMKVDKKGSLRDLVSIVVEERKGK